MIYDFDQSYGTMSHNGRVRAANEAKTPQRSPEEAIAWAMMEQAIDDLVTLCRWGLLTSRGLCMPWPKRRVISKHGYPILEWVKVATMTGPRDHYDLREFFLNPTQGQYWADLIGMRLPMEDVWHKTLQHNCGRNPQ